MCYNENKNKIVEFDFWERSGGKSPAFEFLQSLDKGVQDGLVSKLENIELMGFDNARKTKYFKLIQIQKGREVICQINYKQYRLIFIIRRNVGYIMDVFMKKSHQDEQKRYKKALARAEWID